MPKAYITQLEKIWGDNIDSEALIQNAACGFLSDSGVAISDTLAERFYGLVSEFSSIDGKDSIELAKRNMPYILCLFDLDSTSYDGRHRHDTDIFFVTSRERKEYSEYLEDIHKKDPTFALSALRLLPLLFKKKGAEIRERDLYELTREHHSFGQMSKESVTRHPSLSLEYFEQFKRFAEANKEFSLKFLRKISELDDEQISAYIGLVGGFFSKDSSLASKLIDLPAEITANLICKPDDAAVRLCINMAYSIYSKSPNWDGWIEGRRIFSLPHEQNFIRYSGQLAEIEHPDIFRELLTKLGPLTIKLGHSSTASYINAVKRVSAMDRELGLEFAKQVYIPLEKPDVDNANFYIENLLGIAEKNMNVAAEAARTLASFIHEKNDLEFVSGKITSLLPLDDSIILEFMKNSPLILKSYNRGMLEIYSDAIEAANKDRWRTAYAVAKMFPQFIKSYINGEVSLEKILESAAPANRADLFILKFLKTGIKNKIGKEEPESILKKFLEPLVEADTGFNSGFKEILMNALSQQIHCSIKTYEDALKISGTINLDLVAGFKGITASLNKFYGDGIMPSVLEKIKGYDSLEVAMKGLASAYHLNELDSIMDSMAAKRGAPFSNKSIEPDKILYTPDEARNTEDFDLIFIAMLGYLAEKGILTKGKVITNNLNRISEGSFDIHMPYMQNAHVMLKKDILLKKYELEMTGISQAHLKEFYNALAHPHKLVKYAKLSMDALCKLTNVDYIDLFSGVYFDSVRYTKICMDLKKKEIPRLFMDVYTLNKKGMEKALMSDKSLPHDYLGMGTTAFYGEQHAADSRITFSMENPCSNLEKIKSLEQVISGGFMDEHHLAVSLYNRVKSAELREYIAKTIDFDVMNAFFSFEGNGGKLRRFLKSCSRKKKEQFRILKGFIRRR